MVRRNNAEYGFEDDFDDDDNAEDQELKNLERRLNEEVEESLFTEPKYFNTLSRVIDVLGLQMIDGDNLEKNPAYNNLKHQQKIVNGAIEHMAVIHCADLNGSVIQVGRVARQFSDAVSQVRQLRKQVRDIQDTLGAKSVNRKQSTSMSLRELWLKKLECESTLALLNRLDVIRAAPSQFDSLVQPPLCRIGAGVLTLSKALSTMFSDDIAQVQALHKIMEQLLLRKQKAEEIVWDTIADVVYLRTGNGLKQVSARHEQKHSSTTHSAAHSVSSESRRSRMMRTTASGTASVVSTASGMVNPFATKRYNMQADDDSDDDDDDDNSNASLFSLDDAEDQSMLSETPSMILQPKRMMIPIPMIEAELDLEADERRCLEEIALSGMVQPQKTSRQKQRSLPRYADPVLALRILVECLAHLDRLDDVERVMSENLEKELKAIVQNEQARTFARLEKKRNMMNLRTANRPEDLSDFRQHLTNLLSAFGCVIVRLSHLAEVVRIRIGSDKTLLQKMEHPSSVLRAVISGATETMQAILRDFLKACLVQAEAGKSDMLDHGVGEGSKAYEAGLFTLGIAETGQKSGEQVVSTATRSNVMEMSTTKFVTTVLFPKTKATPQVRHALTFRRSVAKWNSEIEALKKELATLTGEDTSSPSYNSGELTSIAYLDNVIQRDLLPVLQEEAVNGTVRGLERRDAFDPVLGRGLYSQVHSSEPQDIEMCIACQAMHQYSGPLFMALHRLPRGGKMYTPIVAVLEHVLLTFISRVKQQVARICERKTAYSLLLKEDGDYAMASIMERRRPCSLLSMAYADGDLMDNTEDYAKQRGLAPLTPSASDTASRRSSPDMKNNPALEEIGDGVEGEEKLMLLELQFVAPYFKFDSKGMANKIVVCSDEELMKASCLAHSLLKLSSLLESRMKVRGVGAALNKTLTSTRALREANKTIKNHGMKMAKFCRLDMLMQVAKRTSTISSSSTLAARDAVRIPSSVNDLGEYLTAASDNLREAAGNAVTGYTLSSLEQYVPYSLMQTVRTVAVGDGVVKKAPLTMNGIEALDRSGSVLYRDLKGATSFDNSYWDMELAAISFERSASFMAMMELEMEELVAYYAQNRDEFPEEDFQLMFSMTGPRRRGDIGRYHMAKKNMS